MSFSSQIPHTNFYSLLVAKCCLETSMEEMYVSQKKDQNVDKLEISVDLQILNPRGSHLEYQELSFPQLHLLLICIFLIILGLLAGNCLLKVFFSTRFESFLFFLFQKESIIHFRHKQCFCSRYDTSLDWMLLFPEDC